MKQTKYFQCRLKQYNRETVGWIEERGATLGSLVEVEELGGLWEVIGVGEKPMLKSEIRENENNRRNSFLSIKPK